MAVKNTANAPVTVALDHEDPDNELKVASTRRRSRSRPARPTKSQMVVRPPRQKWIGRPEEKRLSVHTRTGEEALRRDAAAEAPAEAEAPRARRARRARAPRRRRGGMSSRLGGARPERERRPERPAGHRPARPAGAARTFTNLRLSQLKVPGGGTPAPNIPLQPNQVVFRQKAWLPWWIMMLVPLLILLAVLLFLFLPRNVTVPEVTGSKSTFDAEQKLVEADLKLAPAPKEKVSTEAPPGTVIGQTPEAGEKAKKDSEVALLIAVGNGKVQVPSVVGQTQAEAEKTLREKKLTIGQLQPQPPDPKAKISSQIPAADEVVTEGKPIDLFMATIKDKKKKGGDDEKDGGGGGGGGGKAAAVTLAPLAGLPVAEAAQTAADAGLVPEKVTEFSGKKKGELIRTEPEPGTKLAAGAKVKLVVSGGFPQAGVRRRQERQARQRRQRQAAPRGRQGLAGGDRPDVLRRRRRRSPSSATAGSSSGTSPSPTSRRSGSPTPARSSATRRGRRRSTRT